MNKKYTEEALKGATKLHFMHYFVWSLFCLIQHYAGPHFLWFLLENYGFLFYGFFYFCFCLYVLSLNQDIKMHHHAM